MSHEGYKIQAAEAAVELVEPGTVVGVGTGSTVNHFIEALARIKHRIDATVSSSDASTARLEAHGIRVVPLDDVGSLPLYVDGADEANPRLQLIKGGGGALTREKIITAASRRFVCIADESKLVDVLGRYPLPIEIIPMARRLVADELAKHGGRAVLREQFVTDNGNFILDVHDLRIVEPVELEDALNAIPGIVTVGLFARRPADRLLLGGPQGVRAI